MGIRWWIGNLLRVWMLIGSEMGLIFCGEMGIFRGVCSMIFADECGGMTIHFYPGIRSIFGEKYPLHQKI